MTRTTRQWALGLLLLTVISAGIAGCGGNNTEPPGKHDTAEMKQQRQAKKGD